MEFTWAWASLKFMTHYFCRREGLVGDPVREELCLSIFAFNHTQRENNNFDWLVLPHMQNNNSDKSAAKSRPSAKGPLWPVHGGRRMPPSAHAPGDKAT